MSNEDYNNEEEQVEDSADLSTEDNNNSYEEDDTTDEGEGEASDESNVERKPETSEQRVARLKRQLEREERKLGIESKEDGKESRKENKPKEKQVDADDQVMERLDRGDLRYEGVKDKGEQDIIIEYAKWKGMDVLDAMSSAAVKAELKEYRAKSATPSPSRRTATGTRDDVAYWADQMKKGNRPPTAEMRTKARDYLAKNR